MDVIIIGAGPAGLFAADKLSRETEHRITVLEMGKESTHRRCHTQSHNMCTQCDPCDIYAGIGGAGALSDGKLNLTPRIGGDPDSLHHSYDEIAEYIKFVDETFLRYGADVHIYGDNKDDLNSLRRKASASGIEFISGVQRHMGSDKTPLIIDRFYKELKARGVTFLTKTKIHQIECQGGKFFAKAENATYAGDYLIVAPGRAGAYWFRTQARLLGIENKYGPIDVGVRVEFPATLYEPVEQIMYDAKFKLYTKTYDDMVRTFCTNPRGFVTEENYPDFVMVNGHAKKEEKSDCTNLALLTRIQLTDPVEDTTEYGRSIARLATTIGGGKPILQRYKDLIMGRRSTWNRIKRCQVAPTLKNATPGDISMALPHRIVTNIVESVERLDSVIEGIASDSTLLYAAEIKFYDTKYPVSRHMETNIPNLYVAGDASGHSRGIVYAAVTGILAAEGIISKG
ncbi:MAG: NAD(P)/FAD-dependent oxidoreductase [Candidatus Methanofastidiosa archaeon]|nr:NAD(P)/FAD-dependent oxidoreductase [Candidatus Methanofastidiosa archaeon]